MDLGGSKTFCFSLRELSFKTSFKTDVVQRALVVSGGQHSNRQQYSAAFTRWCYFRPVGFTDRLVIADEGEWGVGGDRKDEGDEGNNLCPIQLLERLRPKRSYAAGFTATLRDALAFAQYKCLIPLLSYFFTHNTGYYILGFIAVGVLMSISHKYTVIAFVSLSIALFITSCNGNKVSQCQRLIRVVNAGTSLIDKNKGTQVITSLQLSKDLEFVTKSIGELKLTDPKLKEFQSSFVKIFQNLSEAIAKAARALGATKTAEASASGREKIEKARVEIDSALTAATTVGKQSDTLVNEMNKYCSQPD